MLLLPLLICFVPGALENVCSELPLNCRSTHSVVRVRISHKGLGHDAERYLPIFNVVSLAQNLLVLSDSATRKSISQNYVMAVGQVSFGSVSASKACCP